jgi:hypothetical protein
MVSSSSVVVDTVEEEAVGAPLLGVAGLPPLDRDSSSFADGAARVCLEEWWWKW